MRETFPSDSLVCLVYACEESSVNVGIQFSVIVIPN